MSRSFKKHAYCKDGRDGRKYWKRQANRKIRNEEDVPDGKAYKKKYDSWNIHDCISRWTWKTAKEEWEQEGSIWQIDFPNIKNFYRFWKKNYHNK